MNPTIRIIQETDRTFSFSVQMLESAGTGLSGNLQFLINWSFGDGQQGYGRRVLHTYSNDGEYEVSATISVVSSETSKTSITETLTVNTGLGDVGRLSTGDPHQDPDEPEMPKGGFSAMSTGDPHQDPDEPEMPK